MSDNAYIFNPRGDRLAATGNGFQIPRLSSSQRLALGTSAADAGMMVFDISLSLPFMWDGAGWISIGAGGASYSEGTVTATFTTTTGSVTLDPAARTGRWAKVGNLVCASGRFVVQSVSSPSGSLFIGGLPFPVAPAYPSSLTICADGLNNLARTALCGTITGSGAEVFHYDSGSLNDMGPHVLPGSEWFLSCLYFVS